MKSNFATTQEKTIVISQGTYSKVVQKQNKCNLIYFIVL